MNTIANTKLRFKLSLSKECIPVNEILGSSDRGVANTHLLSAAASNVLVNCEMSS